MARLLICFTCLSLAGLALNALPARASGDPTAPPDALRAAASADAQAGQSIGQRAPPRLQAILSSPERPAAVVIDGRSYELGERIGAARVSEIHADRVVLSGADGRRVLSLTPEVSKRPAQPMHDTTTAAQGTPRTGAKPAKASSSKRRTPRRQVTQ